MLKIFNNFWVICIAIIIVYYIIITLFNLNKPIDHDKYLNYIIRQKDKDRNKKKLLDLGLIKEEYSFSVNNESKACTAHNEIMNSRCQNRTLESTISNTAEKSTRKIKDSSTRVKDNIYSYTTEKSINFNKIKLNLLSLITYLIGIHQIY